MKKSLKCLILLTFPLLLPLKPLFLGDEAPRTCRIDRYTGYRRPLLQP
jgi:hypothetical protein